MKTKFKDDLLEETLEKLFEKHQKESLKNKDISVLKDKDLSNTEEKVNLNVKDSSKAKQEVLKGTQNISEEARNRASSYSIDSTNISEEFFDDEKYGYTSEGFMEPTEPETTTLPAIMARDLLAADNVHIEWTSIKDLPGFAVKEVRALGRAVFSNFTDTNPDDIVTMACTQDRHSLTGHEMREINAVAGWARENAIEKPEFASVINMDFKDYIKTNPRGPIRGNYEPQAAYYETGKLSFLLVNDFMGKYIYAWETKQKEELSQKIQDKINSQQNNNKNKRPRLR